MLKIKYSRLFYTYIIQHWSDVYVVCSIRFKVRRSKTRTHTVKKVIVVGKRVFFVACPHLPTNYIGTEFSLGLLSACLKFIDVYSLFTLDIILIHSHAECVDFKSKKLNMDKSFVYFFRSLLFCLSLFLLHLNLYFSSSVWMNVTMIFLFAIGCLSLKHIHKIKVIPHKIQ